MNEKWIKAVEDAYVCRIRQIGQKRSVYFVETDKGSWVLKRYRSRELAAWVTTLAAQVRQKGFPFTVEYERTKWGAPYLPRGDGTYTVMRRIPGEELSYVSAEGVAGAMRCLALFHRHATGIRGGNFVLSLSSRPPLLEKWNTRLEKFEKIIAWLHKKNRRNHLEKLLLEMAPNVRKAARRALEIAEAPLLAAETARARHLGIVAHRDLASHNFLAARGGSVYLLDLDTAAYDWPLVDLVQIGNRILAEQEWRFEAYAEALAAYEEVRPLTDVQRALAYCLLRYPDEILREVNGLYERQGNFRSPGVFRYIANIARHWRERERFFAGAEHFLQ
ncbi:hypothetical protein BSNK01_03670 [Bacillaceae bacterium]